MKKSFLSGIVFFGTVLVLAVGYAAWDSPIPMGTVISGASLTATGWNALVNNLNDLNTRSNTLASNQKFTSSFESAEIPLGSISTMVKTVAHGLGARPTLWKAVLRCKVAEIGYSVGDEIDVTSGGFYNWYAYYTAANVTNIIWTIDGTFSINRGNDAGLTNGNITAANWVLVVRAWK